MSCLICLENKNIYYNLCNNCNNCFVCKECYLKDDMKEIARCMNCRTLFERSNRRYDCKDFIYTLWYFRNLILYIISMICLPIYNGMLYFPDKNFMEEHPYIIQSEIVYFIFIIYMSTVLFPYIFNHFRNNTLLFFFSVSNCIITMLFPSISQRNQYILHLYYNISCIYICGLFLSTIVIYIKLHDFISCYINDFNETINVRTSNIKIQNNYITKSNTRISPLNEVIV